MPELPEVETVARGLASRLIGRQLSSVELRRETLRLPIPPTFVAQAQGRRVVEVSRRAKYLLIQVDTGTTLIGHLGMSGKIVVHNAPVETFGAHDHVVFRTDDQQIVVYTDPRRFGLWSFAAPGGLDAHPLLAKLGPEPLAAGFTPQVLWQALRQRSGPLKALLLDQSVVAGLGNIYVCEALFAARISPFRAGHSLLFSEARRLHREIATVLTRAIDKGGSTLRDYVGATGDAGGFQSDFLVYDRAGQPCTRRTCPACIAQGTQAGRSTYYCPGCQR